MIDVYEAVKRVVADCGYKLLDDNGRRLVIRYQMSPVYIWPGKDEQFVMINISGFPPVTEDNFGATLMKCNDLNDELKQIKFYINKDSLIVSSEFFFEDEDDLAFHVKNALSNLALAKGRFKR